ncbi:MAG: tRNA threonylcarbamoyladenosine dehydratase [Bacteroidales bacterium]
MKKVEKWTERTELLMGKEIVDKLVTKRCAIIGLGGVGAYAAEMLARAGVGHLFILDSDNISISNKNRQLLAMDSTIHKSKVKLMYKRLLDINPELDVIISDEYLTSDNIEKILSLNISDIHNNKSEKDDKDTNKIDYLIDAIDTLAPKLALISYCVHNSIPIVSSMGVGAKYDATKIRIADVSKSFNCPLAYIIRKNLRKMGIYKGFKVVFSEELPDRNAIIPVVGETNKKSQTGSISYMPAVFGCVCAQEALSFLRIN